MYSTSLNALERDRTPRKFWLRESQIYHNILKLKGRNNNFSPAWEEEEEEEEEEDGEHGDETAADADNVPGADDADADKTAVAIRACCCGDGCNLCRARSLLDTSA
mmetsp:Transcript_18630/g.36452  ORF Transcript_18630/g.36452 Transcript_18630/m.36452 type:complete len:106 (+) Transcript_18630:726-1043(+)